MKRFVLAFGWGWAIGAALYCAPATAIDVINENPNLTCQHLELFRELSVYKDPTLFLSDLSLIYLDPSRGWKQLLAENPLVTRLHGVVQLMQLAPAREFKNFGAIAKLYEAADPRFRWDDDSEEGRKSKHAWIVPIEVCGTDAYNSTLGFVLQQDLKSAQQYDQRSASLPPSVYPNPIPVLRD